MSVLPCPTIFNGSLTEPLHGFKLYIFILFKHNTAICSFGCFLSSNLLHSSLSLSSLPSLPPHCVIYPLYPSLLSLSLSLFFSLFLSFSLSLPSLSPLSLASSLIMTHTLTLKFKHTCIQGFCLSHPRTPYHTLKRS